MNEFKPSAYQQAIFEWGQDWQPSSNLVVEALAGSGKTTTCVKMLSYLPSGFDVTMLAFNKHIADNLSTRVPQGSKVKTYHALGLWFVSKAFGKVNIDNGKMERWIKRNANDWSKISAIRKLVGLCKAYLSDANDDDLMNFCYLHNIDTDGDRYEIFSLVRRALNYSKTETNIIDFDDMCWLPTILNLSFPICDMIIVDEVQDTNPAQLELAIRSVKSDGRIVGVGDRFQSIYGFRGADVNAIPNLISRLQADVLPLSITYRNPRSVVNLVNQEFPNIPLECADNADEGSVTRITSIQASELYSPGDMILCRTNAPLVEPCFELIRKGVKAIIKGRDIGSNLATVVKRMRKDGNNDIVEMLRSLHEYTEIEADRLLAQEKLYQYITLIDKEQTISALADGCNTVDDLLDKISLVFSDDVVGVTFSSIHKAKGLEAENVTLLHPELLPHPMAKQDWECQQESNMKYVAYTRPLKNLRIVEG